MAFQVHIRNLQPLLSRLNRFPQIAIGHTDNAIRTAIFEIERETKPITPVKTGRLLGSWQSAFRQLEGRFYTNVNYAKFVHEKYPPGQRYLNPSKNKSSVAGFLIIGAKQAQGRIDEAFQQALNNITRDLGD